MASKNKLPKQLPETFVETEGDLVGRIREAVKNGPYTQEKLSELMGYSQGNMSKMLRGDIAWKKSALQKFCELYDLNFLDLFAGKKEMDVSALMGPDGFDFAALGKEDYGKVPIPPESEYPDNQIYAIKLVGDDFLAPLKEGRILYAAKNSGEDAETNDIVVFIDDENRGMLCQLRIAENYIILKALNRTGQEFVRTVAHKRMLDKIVWMKFD
jgi:hypothetical protein